MLFRRGPKGLLIDMKTKSFGNLNFRIDRPKGTVKTWNNPDGTSKTRTYPVDYGYFPRIKGEDGEGLDAFVGDSPNGHFEVFQKLKKDEKRPGRMVLDETKFLVGLNDEERKKAYNIYDPQEIHARRSYSSLGDLEKALTEWKGSHKKHGTPVEKAASRANPFGLVTQNSLYWDEDQNYDLPMSLKNASFKLSELKKELLGNVESLNAGAATRTGLTEDVISKEFDRFGKNPSSMGEEQFSSVPVVEEMKTAKDTHLLGDDTGLSIGRARGPVTENDRRSRIDQAFDRLQFFDPHADPVPNTGGISTPVFTRSSWSTENPSPSQAK